MAETSGDSKPAAETETKQDAGGTTEDTPEPTVKEMRAVVLTGFGGLKSVKVMKKPEPKPDKRHVLIRVKAW